MNSLNQQSNVPPKVHSTILEIRFTKLTKLAKLTNVYPSAFYIKVHQCVLGKLYTNMEFVFMYSVKVP